MSNSGNPATNPVRDKLATYADGTLSIRTGFGATPQALQIKTGALGSIQGVYNLTAAEEADLTIANTAALEGLTTAVEALGPEVVAQTQAATETNTKLDGLKQSVDALTTAVTGEASTETGELASLGTLATKLDAVTTALATLNGYNATIAAGSASGTNYSYDFTAAGSTSMVSNAMAADAKLLRVIVSASTLLGTILGGGAKIYVYHCAGASDAYNASGAVLLGTYPVASNSSYVALNGRLVPKGRFLRAQASNGGCSISMDVA